MKKSIIKDSSRKLAILSLVAAAVLLTGCLKSLNPFYTAEQLVDSTPYHGVWESSGNSYWVFMPMSVMDKKETSFDISDGIENTLNAKSDANLKVDGKVTSYRNTTEEEGFSITLSGTVGIDSLDVLTKQAEQVFKNSVMDLSTSPSDFTDKYTLLIQFKDSLTAVQFFKDPESVDIGEDEQDLYIAAFFDFDGKTMLDISPYTIFGDNSFKGRHHIPVHSLSIVEDVQNDKQMRLKFFSSSRITELIEDGKVRIDYMVTQPIPKEVMEKEDGEGELFLTAKTADLQAFVEKLINMGNENYLSSNGNYLLKKIRS